MRLILAVLSVLALTSPLVSTVSAAGVGEYCCDRTDWACAQKLSVCDDGLACCYSRPIWHEQEGGTCYDPKTQACANCPVYNPNHPETRVCGLDSPTCCGDCIDNTKQCCHHYLSNAFFTCGADQTCCGFDNGQQTCCDSTQSCVNDVCVPKSA